MHFPDTSSVLYSRLASEHNRTLFEPFRKIRVHEKANFTARLFKNVSTNRSKELREEEEIKQVKPGFFTFLLGLEKDMLGPNGQASMEEHAKQLKKKQYIVDARRHGKGRSATYIASHMSEDFGRRHF